MEIKSALKDQLIRLLAGCVTPRVRDMLCHTPYFRAWEKRGLHITPVHYSQPIPDTRELEGHAWDAISGLPGLDMNGGGQLDNLAGFCSSYRGEYSGFRLEADRSAGGFFVNNGAFESVDCEAAYCFTRSSRPARVIEVGGGNSTFLLAMALAENSKNAGVKARHTVIEPLPGPALKTSAGTSYELVEKKLEELPEGYFSELQANDILFIDSSHVIKTGNDVNRLYLEILPRLKKGVLVHIHDIFLPTDYPRSLVMDQHRFCTEQYLVQAFLSFNSTFRVEWGSSFLHQFHPEKLEAAFPSYERGSRRPGSLWLRKIL